MTGFVTKMGLTAVVETAGNQVVLTSLRTMPFDAEQLRCLGIEPASQAMIVVEISNGLALGLWRRRQAYNFS